MPTIDACPECSELFTSRSGTMSTLVGFRSPEGHNHDDNCTGREYYCPNGHKTTIALRRSCPSCDWRGKETCFCHPGGKVDRWPLVDVAVERLR
jgi:hypothetical protein